MVLLGCKPKGRLTEQHDVFFGIAENLSKLVPHIHDFWPEAKGEIHIDAWREINQVGNYKVTATAKKEKQKYHLFFINLGGYKAQEFEEYHYKILTVAENSAEAIRQSKNTVFYKHTGIKEKGGASHIDDKYGVDTDDLFKIEDVLSPAFKAHYSLHLVPETGPEDCLHIGYVPVKTLR